MIDLMAEHNIVSYLNEKYVDDGEVVIENMDLGTRWDGDRLLTTPETVEEDAKLGKHKDQVTMEAWGAMASSLVPGLLFTVDYCSRNESRNCPHARLPAVGRGGPGRGQPGREDPRTQVQVL